MEGLAPAARWRHVFRMAAPRNDHKRKLPPRLEDIELAPDAWERFTRTVQRMADRLRHRGSATGGSRPSYERALQLILSADGARRLPGGAESPAA